MCDNWDELREALRLLGDDKQTYYLRSPKRIDYVLSTLDLDIVDNDHAHISLTNMKGQKYFLRVAYPFGIDQMNDMIYDAYKS